MYNWLSYVHRVCSLKEDSSMPYLFRRGMTLIIYLFWKIDIFLNQYYCYCNIRDFFYWSKWLVATSVSVYSLFTNNGANKFRFMVRSNRRVLHRDNLCKHVWNNHFINWFVNFPLGLIYLTLLITTHEYWDVISLRT